MTDAVPMLFTIRQFASRHPAFSQGALRSYILHGTDRLTSRGQRIGGNGLFEAGAIVRVGRRVLIDERAFFHWIAQQQKNNGRSAA